MNIWRINSIKYAKLRNKSVNPWVLDQKRWKFSKILGFSKLSLANRPFPSVFIKYFLMSIPLEDTVTPVFCNNFSDFGGGRSGVPFPTLLLWSLLGVISGVGRILVRGTPDHQKSITRPRRGVRGRGPGW